MASVISTLPRRLRMEAIEQPQNHDTDEHPEHEHPHRRLKKGYRHLIIPRPKTQRTANGRRLD